ncbi:hypothetical protein K431DRAFT_287054 [Polychaeton citri CBS 116435]|uniref:C2H2-type domain-containing protein n=1 Tax=Polychaeton citri CBS 116435 TaxID=1314669 RepID=A0A9P4UMP6_9PEZI|nr:hypothetical protein K431DRAFT_287054 [Polychaeton citri CBS 116435]
MTRSNLIYVNRHDGHYICTSCDNRRFSSETALLQHVRTANIHHSQWCERCEWLFVSAAARSAHLANAINHWVCNTCGIDEGDRDSLHDHIEQEHFRCCTCHAQFSCRNDVLMHQQTHQAKDRECYGCYCRFASESGILIHLESGSCAGGVDRGWTDIWAFEFDPSGPYINNWDSKYQYSCPTCGQDFRLLSGLLQHIESPACNQVYDGMIQRLLNHLVKKVEAVLGQRNEGTSRYQASDSDDDSMGW